MSKLMGFGFAACLLLIWTTGVPAANPDWPKSLTLGTASPGGVYYVYGDELAKILTEKLGITVNSLPTQGSIQNVKLLDSGAEQLGLITMSTGLEGWNGTGNWTNGKKFRDVRALFPMYDNPFQAVVLRRSGITTFAQLDKKRIGVGPRAGNGSTYVPGIFKIVGISGELSYGSYNDMAAELLDGRIDALLTLLGAPVPAIQQVDAKEPVTFLSLSPEQMDAIRKVTPDFGPAKIAAGTYRLLNKDYVTVGVPNFVIGRADLPGRSDLSIGQSSLREPAASRESYVGGKRHHPAECCERHLPAVSPWRGPLLPRDRHQHSELARCHELIGPSGKEETPMSRLMGLMFAACLLAIATSTTVPAANPDWPKSLTLGTASPGGIYYVYGEALAQILTEKLGIPVNPLPTQGTVHDVKLIEGGGAQLGMTTMGVALEGWNGTGDWTKGMRFRNMRALFPMYDTPFQAVVLRRSGITRSHSSTRSASPLDPVRAPAAPTFRNIEASRDFSRNQLWIVRRDDRRNFFRSA